MRRVEGARKNPMMLFGTGFNDLDSRAVKVTSRSNPMAALSLIRTVLFVHRRAALDRFFRVNGNMRLFARRLLLRFVYLYFEFRRGFKWEVRGKGAKTDSARFLHLTNKVHSFAASVR